MAIARLLAKVYHELGILRTPKFLEVERLDLILADQRGAIAKTREVLEEASGGIFFIVSSPWVGRIRGISLFRLCGGVHWTRKG